MFSDIEIMARTIYGEARGEPVESKIGVVNVIVNRLKHPRRFGKTVHEVCLKPYQFSCWLKGDNNYPLVTMELLKDTVYDQCIDIAKEALRGDMKDNTLGANHYYSKSIAPPYWARDEQFTTELGKHLFFKL